MANNPGSTCAVLRRLRFRHCALIIAMASPGVALAQNCPNPMGCTVLASPPLQIRCIHQAVDCVDFEVDCTDCCSLCKGSFPLEWCIGSFPGQGNYWDLECWEWQCLGGCCNLGFTGAAVTVFGGDPIPMKCPLDAPVTVPSCGCGDERCEGLGECDYLCPTEKAVFKPDPCTIGAANAAHYKWQHQWWKVMEGGAAPCGIPITGKWCRPCFDIPGQEPGYPWTDHEIGNENDLGNCLHIDGPGLFRVQLYADILPYTCISDPITFVKTDWGHILYADVIHVGEETLLSIWMEPWWLDKHAATLYLSKGDAIELRENGQLVKAPITWDPPHGPGVPAEGGIVGPIADQIGDNETTMPLNFTVKGVAPGEVTFTLDYLGCQREFSLTVIQARIDAECVAEGEKSGSHPGLVVFVNKDDDNDLTSGTVDKDDPPQDANPAAPDDDDLARITLSCLPNLPSGAVTLGLSSPGPGMIRVYRHKNRSGLLLEDSGCATLNLSELPLNLYVEGAGPGAGVLTLRYVVRGGVAEDALNVTVVTGDITSLGFTGDHMITIWPTSVKIDDPDGSMHVWIPGISHPVCYTKNAPPTMFATFQATADIVLNPVSVRAKVRDDGGNWVVVGQAIGLIWHNGIIEDTGDSDGEVDNIGGGAPIPRSDRVIWRDPTLTWEVKAGPCDRWGPAGSTDPLNMYFVWSTPLEDPLYDFALWNAVKQYCGADGKTPETAVCSAICTGIDVDFDYNPGAHTYHDLRIYGGNEAGCCCHAALFCLLVRSVGIDGSMVYIWGGCSEYAKDLYIWSGWHHGPSIKVQKPAHDSARQNPHFVFHAEAHAAGGYYDPSYGTAGFIDVSEVSEGDTYDHTNGASVQNGGGLPPLSHSVEWTCPCPAP